MVLSVGVGTFQNLIEVGWKRLSKKHQKKADHVVGMPLDSFKTLYEKQLSKKPNASIKQSYTPSETLL